MIQGFIVMVAFAESRYRMQIWFILIAGHMSLEVHSVLLVWVFSTSLHYPAETQNPPFAASVPGLL